MNVIPVILAGGIGERFWPMSRSSNPKQLLKIISSKTMIEETICRVTSLCKGNSKPLVITGKAIAGKLRKVLPPEVKYDLIEESVGKNTAPAILLAASWIENRYGPSVMVILSADHAIKPKSLFLSSVRTAVSWAKKSDSLVVFGITPSRPDTGYGYLHIGKTVTATAQSKISHVKRFVEKPSQKDALRYLKQTTYLWNSGMFVWKTDVILQEFKNHLSDLYILAENCKKERCSQKAIDRFYSKCFKISIDYGIMERTRNVYAVTGKFSWDDIGSWEALPRIHGTKGADVTKTGENIIDFDCSNSIIVNDNAKATVATIGMKEIALIVTKDAVLAAHRSKLPDLKKYLKQIKNRKNISKSLF